MPLLLLAAGAAGGFVVARGLDETAGIVKWAVIGAGVYVAAKAAKVI